MTSRFSSFSLHGSSNDNSRYGGSNDEDINSNHGSRRSSCTSTISNFLPASHHGRSRAVTRVIRPSYNLNIRTPLSINPLINRPPEYKPPALYQRNTTLPSYPQQQRQHSPVLYVAVATWVPKCNLYVLKKNNLRDF